MANIKGQYNSRMMQQIHTLIKGCLSVVCTAALVTSCKLSGALPRPGNTEIVSREAPWNHKQGAVVLTYDDGLNVHLNHAIPALDSLGLKGTFYIADFGNLRKQIPGWRAAAANGHELANHTVYHPCLGDKPGRSWIKPEGDMNNYTVRRLQDEIKTMNTLLHAIDGKTERTFAFPCNDTRLRDTAYIDGVKNEFIAARAVSSKMLSINNVRIFDIPSYAINGETGEQLIELVKKAIADKALLVFLFHGVGGEHNLNVSLDAHSQLLRFIKQHENELWVAPMVEVAAYVKNTQSLPAK